jgi:hypothetical protein
MHFYTSVIEHQKAAEVEAAALKTRRQERDEQANLMKVWKEDDAKRLERNEARRQVYKEELAQWEAERMRAKAEKQCPTWVKPKLGKLEAPLPKPTIVLFMFTRRQRKPSLMVKTVSLRTTSNCYLSLISNFEIVIEVDLPFESTQMTVRG